MVATYPLAVTPTSSKVCDAATTPVSTCAPGRRGAMRLWQSSSPTSPKSSFNDTISSSAPATPDLEYDQFPFTPPDTPITPCTNFIRSSISDKASARLPKRLVERPDLTTMTYFQPEDPATELRLEDQIGEGQWSVVWGATCMSRLESLSQRRMSRTKLLAVKVVKGKLATEVALNEARILSYFTADYEAAEYIVPFHGFTPCFNGLVMDFISLTLDDFAHFFQGQKFSDELLAQFRPIAHACVAGLDYMHRHDIIHGDIKPSNILLRPIEQGTGLGIQLQGARFQPVYCDFSAARYNSPDCPPNESAGTYDFMAPELFTLSAPDNWTTCASDVYALGISFLYMVIGQSPYEHAHNAFQRRAMAMSATPVEQAGSDVLSASKIHQSGVEQWISQAVKAQSGQRCTAIEWKWAMMRATSY